ncbi:hypothetical protein Tco_1070427 [Tanacetum coccineum]|uniref:BAG domain-containing protein n=1 Tax=Tanacetum coccineum TaxID=301880 RepID=A0ABQ5HNA8_9ASTR
MNQNFNYSNSFGFDQIQPQQQFDNHHPQEIPEVIYFFDNKTKNELYKMMEDFTERMNQELRKQEALLAAQREQELLAQKQAAQEKQVPSPNSDFRQLIEEMCGTKVYEEQKQNMEDTMLDLLEICRQKELYCIHNNVDDLIESALNSKLLLINLNSQHLDKEKKEVKNIVEQATKRRTRITESLQNFKVIHKESTIPLNKTPQISPVNAITHDLPTEEPDNSLSMGDKHLDTIPETEKSSVKNLVPIPSESEDFSDNESECDMPVCDDFTTFSNPLFDSNDGFTSSNDKSLSNEDVPKENFKIYLNPLFDDEEIISTKIDPHYFNAESNLIESLLNRDTLIDSSPKFDYLLEEFSGELAHINLIPPGIEEADFDLEEEIRLVENLSYDNSSPRPPEERNSKNVDTIIESPSPSPIPVEDSDSHMEEIDLFLASDDSMPPGIENDDYDSEGDIRFLEELLSNDPLPLLEIESSNLDHFNDPSSPRPPPEPPDVEICFDVEPDTTMKNDFDELNEDECFDPGG